MALKNEPRCTAETAAGGCVRSGGSPSDPPTLDGPEDHRQQPCAVLRPAGWPPVKGHRRSANARTRCGRNPRRSWCPAQLGDGLGHALRPRRHWPRFRRPSLRAQCHERKGPRGKLVLCTAFQWSDLRRSGCYLGPNAHERQSVRQGALRCRRDHFGVARRVPRAAASDGLRQIWRSSRIAPRSASTGLGAPTTVNISPYRPDG